MQPANKKPSIFKAPTICFQGCAIMTAAELPGPGALFTKSSQRGEETSRWGCLGQTPKHAARVGILPNEGSL